MTQLLESSYILTIAYLRRLCVFKMEPLQLEGGNQCGNSNLCLVMGERKSRNGLKGVHVFMLRDCVVKRVQGWRDRCVTRLRL